MRQLSKRLGGRAIKRTRQAKNAVAGVAVFMQLREMTDDTLASISGDINNEYFRSHDAPV
ncbi:hypothetical protein BOTNAR_0089g00350 [Botryotinia narcissicola]|uniref:Uncharacterized protein n=1 Tax=Botryotinia narcissicola TaxID=278944 RepID=A0A4Z1ISL7_9HELO|nr:hypothetical protein BOTNAR_0089g00350 [Botryotinia narcissicola]